MSTNHYPKKVLAIISLIFLLPPLYLQVLWFNISRSQTSSTAVERSNSFLHHFPESLQSLSGITIFSLVCCIISIICGSRSFNQPALYLRTISIIVVIVASLIALLNIFQML